MTEVLHARAFEDNYIWIVRGAAPDRAVVVDPGDADPVFAALDAAGLRLAAILCTHHHGDHVGGVAALTARFPVPVFGPARERIAAVTVPLADGDRAALDDLGLNFRVLDVPGHTAGHIAYVGHGLLFCGDTLFSAGCGRLFEGTAAQLHASLTRLAALPPETQVYCGHEYTRANLGFARRVEPDNPDIAAHLKTVEALRAADRPSLPSTIGLERRINPFLRSGEPAVRAAAEREAGTTLADPAAVFAALRRWKDHYRG
ncbi:MAG TPA: hydroxyacylglutathione hydrolase [Acidiferrobacterales bacterium]